MTTPPAPTSRRGRDQRLEPGGHAVFFRLATATTVGVIGTVLCYVLMVRTSLGQRFDNAALRGAEATYGSGSQIASIDLSRITGDSFAVVLLVIVGIGALRRRFLLGLAAAVSAGVAVVVTDLLKNHILTRPNFAGVFAYPPGNTFPSGHTAAAVSCAMALVLVSPTRWRGVAAVVAGGYGWLTAALVQTAGWHRPSDAVGAAFLAFAAVTGVGAIVSLIRPVRRRRRGGHRLAQLILWVVGLIDIAYGAWRFSDVISALDRVQVVSAGVDHDAYLTGLTFTVAVVIVLLIALLRLLDGTDLGGWGWSRPRLTGVGRSSEPAGPQAA